MGMPGKRDVNDSLFTRILNIFLGDVCFFKKNFKYCVPVLVCDVQSPNFKRIICQIA